MSKHLEQIDRRAFLRGLTLTSAGLLIPKAVQVFVPNEQLVFASSDFALSTVHDEVIAYTSCHAPFITSMLALFGSIETLRTQSLFPNLSNVPKPT